MEVLISKIIGYTFGLIGIAIFLFVTILILRAIWLSFKDFWEIL